MNILFLCFFSVVISLSVVSVNASIQNLVTDKSLYHDGDIIHISGKVDYVETSPFVILQIITPDGSGFAHIDNIVPNNDGTFSKSIRAGGDTWYENGKYAVKIFYNGNLEKTIEYVKSPNSPSNSPKPSTPTTAPSNDMSEPDETFNENVDAEVTVYADIFVENPKMRIPGYPSFDKSPQYYIDRYNNEPEYRSWFDSQFPEYSIIEVVGYVHTHITDYPSGDKSPQYYIDRYNNEPEYRSWFDSQFPGKIIYDVLGFSTYIPDWIKTYAQYWGIGEIPDHEFMTGLDFMLTNNIIVIPNFTYTEKNTINEIPSWFRNTAQWWSDDLISQQEFINSIKYLIQEEIILVD